jgi:peptidoglycan/LPS O-acetylase OafA/YrhL
MKSRELSQDSSTPALKPVGHLPALDGIRGGAILLVLLFHFGQYGHGLPPPTVLVDKIFYKACQAGWVGVDLFFVLSGFLITGVLYDSKGTFHYFRNFYARRCLRIFPLYYASLMLFVITLPRLFPAHHDLQSLRHGGFWYWTYLSNVWIAYKGWDPFGVLDHFWSLAIEEQFYLVWPVVVLIFKRRTLLWVCATFIGGALLMRTGLRLSGFEIAAYVLTPARMDALGVGALLALLARGPNGLSRVARLAWPVASSAGLALMAILFWRQGFSYYDVVVGTIGHTLLACFFGSMLLIALVSSPSSAVGKLLESPALVFFGDYSYALYVFHCPLVFFRPSFLSFASVPKPFGSQLLAHVLYLVLAILVSVLLALLSWHSCEKQFLKLKRLFPYQSGEIKPVRVLLARERLPSITPS